MSNAIQRFNPPAVRKNVLPAPGQIMAIRCRINANLNIKCQQPDMVPRPELRHIIQPRTAAPGFVDGPGMATQLLAYALVHNVGSTGCSGVQ
jgi:hypothetical protein